MDDWFRLRSKRNKLLEMTDKTQLSDFPIDTKVRSQYRDYRQYLRDLPKMFNAETIKNAKVKTFEEWLIFRRSSEY